MYRLEHVDTYIEASIKQTRICMATSQFINRDIALSAIPLKFAISVIRILIRYFSTTST
jgi:hypothetical protein